MSFKPQRHSKFKHVKGTPFKKDKCYEGIKVSKSPFESNRSDVNKEFLAVILETQGGGSFMVIPLSQTGRLDFNAPKVSGHSGLILDLAFNPFDDFMIASASDDCTINIYELPQGGLTSDITMPTKSLVDGHTRKVSTIAWHPTAANVLASGGFDNVINIWDIETEQPLITLEDWHEGGILCLSWNYNGSMLATSCKDKKIRTIDPRKGTLISEAMIHNGSKSSRVAFCGSTNYVFTTGFSSNNDRQHALAESTNLSKTLYFNNFDKASGIQLIFFDEDTKMIYTVGKGDSTINYFEILTEDPYVFPLTMYSTSTSQVAACAMPKRYLNHNDNEVMRLYKIHNSSLLVEPISMTVPRKANTFQSDIFPPCYAGKPVLTAEEWMSGVNKNPALTEITKDGVKGEVAAKPMLLTSSAPPPARLSKQSSHSSTGSSGHGRERTPSPPLVIESISSVQNDEENRALRTRVQELEAQNERLKRQLKEKEDKLSKIKDLL